MPVAYLVGCVLLRLLCLCPPLQDSPLERLQTDSPQMSEITLSWDFPGGPVVKTLPSSEEDVGSIPDWGTHALQPKKSKHKQQKQYCNKFNKDCENGPYF